MISGSETARGDVATMDPAALGEIATNIYRGDLVVDAIEQMDFAHISNRAHQRAAWAAIVDMGGLDVNSAPTS